MTASGKAQQSMDEATDKGMSPEDCAAAILQAIHREKYEAYIGGKETMAVYLKRWFPKILHRVVQKSAVT